VVSSVICRSVELAGRDRREHLRDARVCVPVADDVVARLEHAGQAIACVPQQQAMQMQHERHGQGSDSFELR